MHDRRYRIVVDTWSSCSGPSRGTKNGAFVRAHHNTALSVFGATDCPCWISAYHTVSMSGFLFLFAFVTVKCLCWHLISNILASHPWLQEMTRVFVPPTFHGRFLKNRLRVWENWKIGGAAFSVYPWTNCKDSDRRNTTLQYCKASERRHYIHVEIQGVGKDCFSGPTPCSAPSFEDIRNSKPTRGWTLHWEVCWTIV